MSLTSLVSNLYDHRDEIVLFLPSLYRLRFKYGLPLSEVDHRELRDTYHE